MGVRVRIPTWLLSIIFFSKLNNKIKMKGQKMTEPIIVDDFLPKFYYKSIMDSVDTSNISWYFLKESSGWETPPVVDGINFTKNQTGFAHTIYNENDGGATSQFYPLFYPIQNIISEVFNLSIERLIRIRLGLITNIGITGSHYPHVDMKFPHKTVLLYLNDSDGDTIFYNESFVDDSAKSLSVSLTNTPKKNQAVLFDGLQYHSSSFPTLSDYRMTANINFI